MLNIVLPVPISNAELVPECLEAIEACTLEPFELHVIIDGGEKRDWGMVDSALMKFQRPWKLTHHQKPIHLNACLREALSMANIRNRVTAVVGPEVRLQDPKWFSKMERVFMAALSCGIADADPDTKSTTMPPVRRASHRHPSGCRLFLLSTRFAIATPPIGPIDPSEHWSQQAIASGGTSWHVPSVRYTEVEHKEHKLWPESATVVKK